MQTLNDVHQQFAEYFPVPVLKPYAWLLSKKLSEGHICLHLDKAGELSAALPAAYSPVPPGAGANRMTLFHLSSQAERGNKIL